MTGDPGSGDDAVLLRVVRDGVVESVHRGSVVVAGPDGRVLGAVGSAAVPTYVRSAAKPFQTVATRAQLAEHGVVLTPEGLAIASASHVGSDVHQIEAAQLLALAGLDEADLRCPPALPNDLHVLLEQRVPLRLAHNCSGKHASFLYATVAAGDEPARYLEASSPLQRRIRSAMEALCDASTSGPGVDGCGAPAWVLPLSGLAVGFARLAAGRDGLGPIAEAMRAHPDLIGGIGCDDTALMLADVRVVAKRGAEGVFGAGLDAPGGAVGVAVKVTDGGNRAAGPVAAAVLAGVGAALPHSLRAPAVLGGGSAHGALEVDAALLDRLGLAPVETA